MGEKLTLDEIKQLSSFGGAVLQLALQDLPEPLLAKIKARRRP